MKKIRTINIVREINVNLDVCMLEKDESGYYQCCLCQSKVKKYDDILLHLHTAHTDDEIFDWDYC